MHCHIDKLIMLQTNAPEKAKLWIEDSYFSQKQRFEVQNILMVDLFLTNTHSFWLHKMLTDGLEWCGLLVDYCDVFISCLDSHSDGTHSLQTVEDPLLSKCCNATFLQICSDEETNSSTSWKAWEWVDFYQTAKSHSIYP